MSRVARLVPFNVLGLAICCTLLGCQGQPQDVSRHVSAAQAAQRAGDFGTAIKEYTILTHLKPGVAEVYSNLGIAYYFHRQPKEALRAFGRALRLKPNLVSALIFSGLAHYDLSDIAQARQELRRAVKLAPNDPLAQTWLGFSDLADSQLDGAEEHFHAAAKLQPDNPDVWYGLGHTYMELGRREIQDLIRVSPDGARLWELAGDVSRLQGDAKKAKVFYQEALRRRPDLPEVRQALTEIDSQQGSSSPAALPHPAAAPHPEKDSAADQHYFRSRDYERRARAAFEKIEAVAPDSYRAHQVLAESLTAQQRNGEAIAEYKKVLKENPHLARIHMAIGDLLMHQGKVRQAVTEYQAELKLRPKAPSVLYRLGHAWLVLSDDQKAQAILREALTSRANIPEAKRDLGKIYVRQRRYTEAIKLLEGYSKDRPEDASAHFLLMNAYKAVGNTAAATRQQQLFQKYSQDVKHRTQAQQAVQFFEQQRKAAQ